MSFGTKMETIMETVFETVIDGAKALLFDTSSILNNSNVEYVVIGGWCPMLRNIGNRAPSQ